MRANCGKRGVIFALSGLLACGGAGDPVLATNSILDEQGTFRT